MVLYRGGHEEMDKQLCVDSDGIVLMLWENFFSPSLSMHMHRTNLK